MLFALKSAFHGTFQLPCVVPGEECEKDVEAEENPVTLEVTEHGNDGAADSQCQISAAGARFERKSDTKDHKTRDEDQCRIPFEKRQGIEGETDTCTGQNRN